MDEELKGPTLLLAAINLGFYVVTSIIGGSILTTGGPAIWLFGFSLNHLLSGYLWVIVTSIFTHSSIAHIGGNLLFLIVYGFRLEEDGIPDRTIILTYLITGMAASLFSALIFFEPSAIMVGASGSVFGLLGSVYGYQNKTGNPNARKVLYVSIILFVFASGDNTNVFAHFLGLVFGILIGRSHYFQKS
jgi:membrane associated rhomboid family serine protease